MVVVGGEGEVKSIGFMETDSLLGGTGNQGYGSSSDSAEDPVSRRVSDTGE